MLKRNLLGVPIEELKEICLNHNWKPFTAYQIYEGIYKHKYHIFEQLTCLPLEARKTLNEEYFLNFGSIESKVSSTDGTLKYLLKFSSKGKVETIVIPKDDKNTVCVSSQVGCSLACTFCHTGTQQFSGNLTAGEILGQYLVACKEKKISNVVYMGQGEPLYNYTNVKNSINILCDPQGIGMSRQRITVSTSGIVPLIEKVGQELKVQLAISLHAANDELRSKIMPINKTYPLKDLIDACKRFDNISVNRRITFEYVMLDSVNDSKSNAKDLRNLVRKLDCHVNLIPFNPWPGTEYRCSPKLRIEQFYGYLRENGISASIRASKGTDILAACGQLKSFEALSKKHFEQIKA